jgi:carboxypeptidase Q
MEAGQPRRTIRVVWFGAEEVSGCGGPDYYARRKDERHALTAESDFGADRVWQFSVKLPDAAKPVADRLAAALAPLGIARNADVASGGADIAPLVRAGVPVIDLKQDGTRYFDVHHTPDDTLDKVDPEQLKQNVAAWTAMLSIVANAPEELAPVNR